MNEDLARLHRSRRSNEVRLRWLTTAATADAEAVSDLYLKAVGRPRRLLDRDLARLTSSTAHPLSTGGMDPATAALLRPVLDRLFPGIDRAGPRPRRIREALWLSRDGRTRAQAVDHAARGLGIAPGEVERLMFADVPTEREVSAPERLPSPTELLERANLALLQRLVGLAKMLRARLYGRSRRVMQTLRPSRLIAEVRDAECGAMELSVSGPLSLHAKTTLYGRALSRLVPGIAAADRWTLHADLLLPDGSEPRLIASNRDPLFRGNPTARFNSKLEEQLHRGFLRVTEDWTLEREPKPVRAGDHWLFPDFLAVHRETQTRVWIELVGFWTDEYLRRKTRTLARVRDRGWLLLVDESLSLDQTALPRMQIMSYRRKVSPKRLLEALNARLAGAGA